MMHAKQVGDWGMSGWLIAVTVMSIRFVILQYSTFSIHCSYLFICAFIIEFQTARIILY